MEATSAAPVEVRGLSKSFRRHGGEIVNALGGIDLVVEQGEIVVLLGPSGCGKTTLLRCIGGLEEPSAGSIQIGGTTVFDAARNVFVPPNRRDVNMMFQSYALWPHMTLESNVGYPLRIAGASRREARATANEYLELVGLGGLGKQYAGSISGGQQQRVALARTLVSQPAVVLFDEPLSNVDAKVRAQLRTELLRLHSELKFAAVYVTHDQAEAMSLGTRLAVMRDGVVDQLAAPVEIYHRPATEYVAQFVGATNIFDVRISVPPDGNGDITLTSPFGELVANVGNCSIPATELDRDLRMMIRPGACTITCAGDAPVTGPNRLAGLVESAVFAGNHTEYTCRIGARSVVVWRNDLELINPGAEVIVHFPKQSLRVLGRDGSDALGRDPTTPWLS